MTDMFIDILEGGVLMDEVVKAVVIGILTVVIAALNSDSGD